MKKYLSEIIFAFVTLLAIILVVQRPVKRPEITRIIRQPDMKYGLPLDSFNVSAGLIRQNQNLSDLLSGYGVNMASIDLIAKKSPLVFDVRRLKAGNRYSLFSTRDSLKVPRYFVYEANEVEFVVFELFDSLKISKGKKEVVTKRKTTSGVCSKAA